MSYRLTKRRFGTPYNGMRHTLRTAGTNTVVDARGVQVSVAVVPLFQRTDTGLAQVVRARVSVADASARIEVRLLDDDQVVAREASVGDGTLDLLVPEVTGERRLTIEASDGSGLLGSSPLTVTEQRKWTVHVVHHSHFDIGYTDPQGVVFRDQLQYLDSALDLAKATDGWPEDAKFRWTVESALPLRKFIAERPRRSVEEFVEQTLRGRIEVTAMPYQMHTEVPSTEELHRQLVLTDQLRREHGIAISSGMHTDVPGAVVGFVDALGAAGVRYLSAAHNWAGRSVPYLHGGQQVGRAFWWRAPSGHRLLVWFTDTPHGNAYMEGNIVGFAAGYDTTLDLLPGHLYAMANRPYLYGKESFGWSGLDDDQITREPYPYDLLHVRVQGGDADNASPSLVPPSVVRQWNETWEWPKLRMSTNTQFFADAEERVGDQLQEFTGDWTDWWADGIGSAARPLGYNRRAQNTVRQAETLHHLASVEGEPTPIGGVDEVDHAYDELGMFDEHTWGAGNPWNDGEAGFHAGALQWGWKIATAYRAFDTAEDLRISGGRRLGSVLAPAADALASYAVVNPGSRARTDVASFFVPASEIPLTTSISLRDGRTGDRLAHHEDVVRPEDAPTKPSGRWIRTVVSGVPGVGRIRLDLVAGDGPTPVEDLSLGTADAPALENDDYRVEYDLAQGAIASIVDRHTGKELVNTGACAGLNQYVYDTYSTAPYVNHLSGHVEDSGDLEMLATRSVGSAARLVSAERTAIGERLEVALTGAGTDGIHTTITLPRGVRRVEIANRLLKRDTATKESVYFAFPFDVDGARTHWELTGGVGGENAPKVPGSAHYFQPIRHWSVVENDDQAVAWSTQEAPLAMFGDINLPYVPFPGTVRPEPAEPGTIYSWALNNIWDTNFPSQQKGEMTFRYAITSATGPANPREFGPRAAEGFTDAFVGVRLNGPDGGESAADGQAAERAYVVSSHPQVPVSSLAGSRSGHDSVVYLRSLADETVETELRFGFGLRAAYVGTSLERELEELSVDSGTVRVRVPAGTLIAVAIDRA